MDLEELQKIKTQLNTAIAGKSAEIDDESLQKGIAVEMEHTDDFDEAERIAKDHLAEDPEYYTKLQHIEDDDEEDEEYEEVKVVEVKESHGEDNGKLDSSFNAKVTYFDDEPEKKDAVGDEPKITIDAGVCSELNVAIKDHQKRAEMYREQRKLPEAAHCEKVVEVLTHVQECLEEGTQSHFDKAVLYFSSLKNDLQIPFPSCVVKFLMGGGNTGRSLKDYFKAKKG